MTDPPTRLDQDTIERARGAQSLASLVAKRVKLRRSGRRWAGLCPFHQEKTPSFSVVEQARGDEFYHCFGCGAHGDAIRWLEEAEGLSFRDAVVFLLGGSLPDGRTRFAPVERQAAERRVDVVSSAHAGRWIWQTSFPARGEIVENYLFWRALDTAAQFLPGFPAIDELRFHPRCPVGAWKVDAEPEDHWLTHPAMVLPIRDAEGAVWGVEVTWLKPDGNGHAAMPKMPGGADRPKRKIFGRAGGVAAWLTPVETICSDAPLIVGEGFETTWSFAQGFGRPCRAIAALSLGNLQGRAVKLRDGSLPLWNIRSEPVAAAQTTQPSHGDPRGPVTLPDAGDVIILVDADMKPLKNQKLQIARGEKPVRADISGLQRAEICAELAAQAWRRAGARSVKCVRPRAGQDFNDQIRRVA